MDSTFAALNWPLSSTRQTMKSAQTPWAVLGVVEEIESPIYVCLSLWPLILPSAIEDNNIAGIKNTTGHPATSGNGAPDIIERGGLLTVVEMPHNGTFECVDTYFLPGNFFCHASKAAKVGEGYSFLNCAPQASSSRA